MKRKQYFILSTIFIYILSNLFFINFAFAQKKSKKFNKNVVATKKLNNNNKSVTKIIAPEIVQTILVVDSNNGKVLEAYNPNVRIHPASLTKLMTLYLTFEAIKNKQLSLNQNIYISKRANIVEPSKMGLGVGDVITVRHAIASLVVKSHNDNAVALAEAIAGSESNFSQLMNATAKKLKMNDTEFYNASGLHHNGQLTTAYDMVKLIMAIKRDYPTFYPFLSQTNFEYRGKSYDTHNRVLTSYQHAVAGKTGFTSKSGFNIITHANYNNKDIIAVVTGFPTSTARDRTVVSLLDHHLGVITDHTPFIKGIRYKSIKTNHQPILSKKKTKRKIHI